jgi:hypothetical protein
VSAVPVRRKRYRRGVRIASGIVLLLAALMLAGCGGGDSESAGDTTATATETTETSEDVTTDESGGDIDGSYTGDDAICKEITNSSSPLNTAASTGQFETVADEWEKLAAEAPAEIKGDIDTIIEGYRKVDEDPLGFGVLDTEPYKTAKANIDAWTAANCGQ